MIRVEADHAVYTHPSGLIVAFWVDDILIFHHDLPTLQSFKTHMASLFSMTDLGVLSYFLGLRIIRDSDRLFISQEHYTERLVMQFAKDTGMNLYGVDIPMKVSLVLVPNPQGNEPYNATLFRKYLGACQYLAVCTRPDIAYAIRLLCQFASNPSEDHFKALQHLVRYLYRTKAYGLLMTKELSSPNPEIEKATLQHFSKYRDSNSKIVALSDADFATNYDRKSIGGNLFFQNGNLISWMSKKMSLVALSTLEAEYTSLSAATRQAVWLRSFYAEVTNQSIENIPAIQQLCDNKGAIKVATNPEDHARTKHFDIHLHFVRQRAEMGQIELMYLPTKEMTADFLTKTLSRPHFERFRQQCGIIERPRDLMVPSSPHSEDPWLKRFTTQLFDEEEDDD